MTDERRDEIAELRALLERLERANVISHALMITLAGLLLGATVSTDAQRHVLSVMRASSSPILEGLAAGYGGEVSVLIGEELFAQLVDSVERMADQYRALDRPR